MKRKSLIIGTSSIAILSALLIVLTLNVDKLGTYSSQDLSVIQKQDATDAQKWLEARYIDLETGEKITSEKMQQLISQTKKMKRSSIIFEEMGPDNIGGRTRAILIDRTNPDLVWAGSVSGGLFHSENGGNSWNRVDAFHVDGMPTISSMTQTEDGTIFVGTGTGLGSDSWTGNGLYYQRKGSDVWELVPGTGTMNSIFEVVSAETGNYVFFSTSTGLKKWTIGAATIESITVAGGSATALQISKDGQVIVVSVASNKTYVSTDAGASFTDKSGTAATNKIPAGSPRIEYAISATKNNQNVYSLYAVRTGGNLLGMHVSHDNGDIWHQFVGSSGTPSILDIYRNQGTYNTILTVDPTNTERILIGGIDIWEWKQTVNNPPSGGFESKSQWYFAPTSPLYVHADNHEMKWSSAGKLYIGNDGGIAISENYGETFYPANRGYNVTQFYGIAMDRKGAVIGGTQDNGTLYNDFSNASYKEFTEVSGGDGFECEISFFNPKVMFSSVYYNAINRSGDGGLTFGGFSPPYPATYGAVGDATGGSSVFPFHTEFVMAEYYDENSEDVVLYSPKKNYAVNSMVKVPSLSSGDTINYVTPTALYYDDTVFATASLTQTDYKVLNSLTNSVVDLGQNSYVITFDAAPAGLSINDTLLVNTTTTVHVASITPYQHYFAQHPASNKIIDLFEDEVTFNISWDTISVNDPFQSWFVVFTAANGGELWGTRDALRLSKTPTWVNFATGVGGSLYSSVDIEFSKDLNACYISCGSGIYRIQGLGSIYSQSPTFNDDVLAAGVAKVKISNANCEGIALNPSNENDLILLQGFSGSILRSDDANGAATFSPLTNLGGVGAYDAIIDRDDPDVIVVGTALGVRISTDGGSSWLNASAGFENVPVFEVRQNWRTWDEGCSRPGEIYLGTFGRGIWASSSLLGLDDEKGTKLQAIKTQLKVYPNPTSSISTLAFNQAKTGNVSIKVYNLAGVLVKTLDLKQVEKGYQTIDINVSNLNNGTYIIKFNSNSFEESIKFIKM